MNSKKLLSLVLSATMTLSLAAPTFAAEEAPAPWYAEAQAYVTEKDIMTGTENGFEPEAEITTATVLQALYNKVGKPDVTKSNDPWYIRALTWAEEEGIFQPEGETPFADGPVARALTLDILTAFCAKNGLASDGLMQGNENGDMMADKVLTRAEFATVLMRLDQLTPYFKETVVAIEAAEADSIPAHTIPGTLCAPAEVEGKKLPAVVMLHGTGSNREEAGNGYQMAAPVMADNGIVTLRIDFMGSGDSTADYSDYCYSSANNDAKAAADYLATLDYVDADKIAVMGWSQGGTNALLVAAAFPETFHAVITWAGALTLNESTGLFGDKTFAEAKAIADKDGSYEMTFDWRDSLQVGRRWFEEVNAIKVETEVGKIEAPILAINGLADTTVDPVNAEKIVAASKNEATKLYLIENCDHTYNVFSGDFTALYETVYAGIGFLKSVFGEELSVTGKVTAVEKYGHAMLDVRKANMAALGFELGDVVTVTAGTYTGDMPYFDGYYVDSGEYMVRGYPSHDTIAVCINYGKFADVAGIGVGDEVTITLKEKGGAATTQAVYSLVYTNERSDYDSDEVFANFREITLGDIGKGKLYRSASPINNENGRAAITDDLAEKAGIQAVMNLADTAEEMAEYTAAEDFDSPYYKGLYDEGKVIVLGMPVNFASDEFAEGIVKGLTFLSENEGPYLVHCTEGKDRAGFTAALLEALMGAKLEEIEADYLQSYVNYYHLDTEADADKCQMIVEKNVHEMLRAIAGLEKVADLARLELVKAAESYLTGHGMTVEAVSALKASLKG